MFVVWVKGRRIARRVESIRTTEISGAKGDCRSILDLDMQLGGRGEDAVLGGCVCERVSAERQQSIPILLRKILTYLTTSPIRTLPA